MYKKLCKIMLDSLMHGVLVVSERNAVSFNNFAL